MHHRLSGSLRNQPSGQQAAPGSMVLQIVALVEYQARAAEGQQRVDVAPEQVVVDDHPAPIAGGRRPVGADDVDLRLR